MSVAPITNQGVSTVVGSGTGTGVTAVGVTSGAALVQAAKILNGIAGDLFGKKGSAGAEKVKDRGALYSPLDKLGKQLVQSYAPALKDLSAKELTAQINVYRGGTSARPLGGTASTRSAATAAQVIPTAFADRGLPQSVASVVSSTGLQSLTNALSTLTTPPSGSSSSAATGLGSLLSGIGSLSSAATSSSRGGDFESGLLGMIQGPPPIPGNVKDERAMLEYQRAMQLYTAMVQMVTQVMQMLHEARKNIIQNLRA